MYKRQGYAYRHGGHEYPVPARPPVPLPRHGPQLGGKPVSYTHLDVYKRQLEHESLYDPDEDVEDLNEDVDADEEETDHKGSFAGSVLLSKVEWDKEQLIRDLREEWGIVDEEPDEGDEDVENSDDAVVMLSLIHI